MRRCYLVCYDICDPRRWRRVNKIMKGYGEPWQYSVFFCVLRAIDRVRLEAQLSDVIHHQEDQVMIIDLGPNEESARASAVTIGQSLPRSDEDLLIL